MPYYHVSSFAKDGDIYYPNQKPLQKYIDEIESFVIHNYSTFLNAYNSIPDNIQEKTGIRKTKWICEAIFESIRKECFSYAPRRLHSIYLCGTIEEALHFNRNFRNNNGNIFQVTINGSVHKYNMQIFTTAEEFLFENSSNISESVYECIKTYAIEYWSQTSHTKQVEYLYEGVAILKQVSI